MTGLLGFLRKTIQTVKHFVQANKENERSLYTVSTDGPFEHQVLQDWENHCSNYTAVDNLERY